MEGADEVVCEDYRIKLMALVDGEVTDDERRRIEQHLATCYHCHEEYESYRHMNEITCAISASARLATQYPADLPRDFSWDSYYLGVCGKMEHGASWAAWSAVSLMLVVAGSLMIFGSPGNLLAMFAGSIALAAGACLVFVSYFCNCSR